MCIHFSTKNIGISEILTFEILTNVHINDVVNFEQPGPRLFLSVCLLESLLVKIVQKWVAKTSLLGKPRVYLYFLVRHGWL